MDIDGGRRTFSKEGKLDRVDVVTAANAISSPWRERSSARSGGDTERSGRRLASAELEDMVSSFQAMTSVFSLLALVVGLVLVANTASVSVARGGGDRRSSRVGAGRRGPLAHLAESATVGVIGALAGAFLGRALASQWSAK